MASVEGFRLYDCKVRLSGSVQNEVPKFNVTAPEITVYQAIHGSDSVVSIKANGKLAKRTDAKERARLTDIFANPALSVGEALEKKMRLLSDLFGHASNALPKEYAAPAEPSEDEDFEIPGEGEDDIVDVDAKPVEPEPVLVRARVTKPKGEQQPAFTE